MSQTEVYCNKVECLQVTIDRKYLLNRLEISKVFVTGHHKKRISSVFTRISK